MHISSPKSRIMEDSLWHNTKKGKCSPMGAAGSVIDNVQLDCQVFLGVDCRH